MVLFCVACNDSGPTEPSEFKVQKPKLGRKFIYEQYEIDQNKKIIENSKEIIEEVVYKLDSNIYGRAGAIIIKAHNLTNKSKYDYYFWFDDKVDILYAYEINGKIFWERMPISTIEEVNDTLLTTIDYGGSLGKVKMEKFRSVKFIENENIVVNSQSLVSRKFIETSKSTSKYLDIGGTQTFDLEFNHNYSPNLGVAIQVVTNPYFVYDQSRWVNGYIKKLVKIEN